MDFREKLNKSLANQDSSKNITIFKDESFNFIYKKSERLVTAIYLITNLMSSEEPLKWQLRKTSIDLIDNVMSLSNATLSSRDIVLRDISKKLFQLISLYKVSFRSGFISDMNYQIVNKELDNLAIFLGDYGQQDNDSRNDLFNEEFFKKDIENPDKEQIKKDVLNKDKIRQLDSNIIKDNVFYKGQFKRQKDKVSFTNTNKSQDRNKRRDNIVNIIKQKGNVSVKDISNIIKDTSEKTLQRELVSMVEEGILKKEGERRWSRYMMNNQ
jgi:hypothetical protein